MNKSMKGNIRAKREYDTINVFNHAWHLWLSHQFSLLQIPDTQWTYLEQCRRPYSTGARDDLINDFNVKKELFYEKGKYDIAILHVDQQCFEHNLWRDGKGSLYRELNKLIKDIPKIVIMHGTPYYPEMFGCDIKEDNYKQKGYSEDQIGMSSQLIDKCKELIGDNVMVTNSIKASK